MTRDDIRTALALWAAKHAVALELEGEVGFGRECVGFTKGNNYLDYEHLFSGPDYTAFEEFSRGRPDDAYHKHPCMAVLGRGEDAERHLYEWTRWLDDNGWTVQTVGRRPDNPIDAMLNGYSTPRLVKAATA